MNGDDSSGALADGTVVRVTGARISAEEATALVAALDAVQRARHPAGAQHREPAWSRAGRRELLGGPPVSSPTDLR